MSDEVYRLIRATEPIRAGGVVTEDNAELVGDITTATHPWWGASSSNVDATPRAISLADMEEVFSRMDTISNSVPPKLMAIYMSPEDYSLLVRALFDRCNRNPSSALCELHGIRIETSSYLARGAIYLQYREGGEIAALQDLEGLLRNEQAEPEDTGTFTESDSVPPPNQESKPFTDDDFDKLIADIEELTNE